MSDGTDIPSRAITFVESQHDYYAEYHHHKEAMAYAGFTVYAAAVGAALFAPGWPPQWGSQPKPSALLLVTLLWFVALRFVKFQLLRRRWAAIRRAGCERLLARWILHPPTHADLTLFAGKEERQIPPVVRIVDYVWPLRRAVQVVETDQEVYPDIMVRTWLRREDFGSQAIVHERLLVVTGWLLWVALIIRTLAATMPNTR